MYNNLELIGSGGEGSVYKDGNRAIKIINIDSTDLYTSIALHELESKLKRIVVPDELIFEDDKFIGYKMKYINPSRNIKDIKRYKNISENLDKAIDYIQNTDLYSLAIGEYEIDGKEVFVRCIEFVTKEMEKFAWEGHFKYADVQIVLKGQEKYGISPIDNLKLTEENPAEDFKGFEGDVNEWAILKPGDILIVFPEDIHAPGLAVSGPEPIKKAIIKVKV